MAKHTQRHPLYWVWYGMKQRCENPRHSSYTNYGGKGITVCERWQKFANFRADMEPSFQEGLQLDRKNATLSYYPDNCQWLSPTHNIWKRRLNTAQTSSKYIGVCYNIRQEKWLAYIKVEGKREYLGTYIEERSAALAYDSRCLEVRGELARLNQDLFPDDFTKIINFSPQPVLGQLAA